MASSVRLLRRYVWLVETIRRAGQITLAQLNERWLEEKNLRYDDEDELPERTFHRHRQAIFEIFDIEIRCNRFNGNTYYIADDEPLRSPSFMSMLFNGLAINNQLAGRKELTKRIVFEETPGGMEYMPLILDAMNRNRKVKIEYYSISSGTLEIRTISPYFIKQRLRRWYLIAKVDGEETLEVFAFDRIESLALQAEEFQFDSTINPQHYFDEVIGILLDDEYDCERVVVRLYGNQARYVDLLPLHSSQRVINRGLGFVDFEYMVRPEWEFIHEILRLGSDAEVISPQWVREEIPWQAAQIVKRYADDLTAYRNSDTSAQNPD